MSSGGGGGNDAPWTTRERGFGAAGFWVSGISWVRRNISLDPAFPVSICNTDFSDHSPVRSSLSLFTHRVSKENLSLPVGVSNPGGGWKVKTTVFASAVVNPTTHNPSAAHWNLAQALVTHGTLPIGLSLLLWASASHFPQNQGLLLPEVVNSSV